MPYALKILWRDRGRYLPAVLAVTFSFLLITTQSGLLFGLLESGSFPIANSSTDIWVATPDTITLAGSRPIPETWLLRVAAQPEVVRTEPLLISFANWHRPGLGSSEYCCVVGMQLGPDSLGALEQLPEAVRGRLSEAGTVVVDRWDLDILGLASGGAGADINGQPVRVVGAVRTAQGPNFSYVYCSAATARLLVPEWRHLPGHLTFGLARCRGPEEVERVVRRLRSLYPEMGVYSRQEFYRRVQFYWLIRGKAGAVMLCTVALSLLVGLIVTNQTLYGAVLASLREYAVLVAIGISPWRLAGLVLVKSFWIGLAGVLLGAPLTWAGVYLAALLRAQVLLGAGLILGTVALTLAMALLSGVLALRPLRGTRPAALLR